MIIEWKIEPRVYAVLAKAADALVEVAAKELLQYTVREGELYQLAQNRYQDALDFRLLVAAVGECEESIKHVSNLIKARG
jgi:hypothetical protein